MKVIVSYKGDYFEIAGVSKAMSVKKFRDLVTDVTKVDPKRQTLFFGGKMFNDDCDLCDYK